MTAPECDCPPCPACMMHVGVTLGWDATETLPPPWLYCPACGNKWKASPEDRAQAERADAAYLARESR